MKSSMVLVCLFLTQGTFASKDNVEGFKPCDNQDRFDIGMCNSFMCTKCVLAFCMEACQAMQNEFAGCRCKDWPVSRKSFSGGDFAGKGKFGDAGDYAKAAAAFLSTEIKAEA